MKLVHWVVIFLAIITPLAIVARSMANDKMNIIKTEVQYNNVIDMAVQDAVDIIKEAMDYSDSTKNIPISPGLAQASINQFFDTMAINFKLPFSRGTDSEIYLEQYIPAIVIVGYDGFYIYSAEEYQEADGSWSLKHVLKPKIPYTYTDIHGNMINFTLDNYITIYIDTTDVSLGQLVYSGYLYDPSEENPVNDYYSALYASNLTDTLLYLQKNFRVNFEKFLINGNPTNNGVYKNGYIQDIGLFNQTRRDTIVACIKEALEVEINKHNSHAQSYGIAYHFNLPNIGSEQWHNTVDDVSVLAFVQGIPAGKSFYNNYSLGGARIVRANRIYGVRGTLTYHNIYCPLIRTNGYLDDSKYTDIFINAIDAAIEGFYPCDECKP